MVRFEIRYRDACGRLGILETRHGKVETPALLPVINPNKLLISPKEMGKLFDTKIIITNAYIIYKHKDLKERALTEGIHELLDFKGVIMTDSGTFQSYVYGDIDVKPREILEFQREIGSDIGTILDVFVLPDDDHEEARKKVRETIKRAREAVDAKGEMLLACTVQGGKHEDLREECAKEMSKLDADVFPIGGVVPLMEKQLYRELAKAIVHTKMHLDPSKPVHLFGAGHPITFPLAVALGCDLLDSAAYAKYASDDRMIFPWGTEKLSELEEIPCHCPICEEISANELKKMEKEERERAIAMHNLYVSFSEMKRVREAIRRGNLWELVEEKSASNPLLMDALDFLREEKIVKWMEKFEPISKPSAFFYTSKFSLYRPIVYRYRKRLMERFVPKSRVKLVPEVEKPYSRHYRGLWKKFDGDVLVLSPFGPVPLALDEIYPIAQSVFPEKVEKDGCMDLLKRFMDKYKITEEEKYLEKGKDVDFERVKAVVDFQFGKGVSEVLLNGKVDIVKSERTEKIRNVYCDGKHVLSMRAHDGLFTLKPAGAKKLMRAYPPLRFRVVVEDEAVPFIKEGKNVFAKFVVDCDPELRPYDECIIVTKSDEYIAVGRCLLNREEMLSFNYGIAVKTREI